MNVRGSAVQGARPASAVTTLVNEESRVNRQSAYKEL